MHPNVSGIDVDEQTRCAHYHSDVDIVAIKFYCCNSYYPCYKCHAELASHPAIAWPKQKFDEVAVLCGVCKHEMTIHEYLACNAVCPQCHRQFNPGCAAHYEMYFQI